MAEQTKKRKFKDSFTERLKRKFGRNRAVLNGSDPGNDKYKRNNVKVVQK